MSRHGRDERGAATVIALALTAVLTSVALVAAAVVAVVVAHRRAQSAADLAALAAARALQRGEDPCAAGRANARAQGAELTGCEVVGEEVTVVATVSGPRLGLLGEDELHGRARAGPAG